MSKHHAEHGHHMTIIRSQSQQRRRAKWLRRQKNGWKKKLGQNTPIVSRSGSTPEITRITSLKATRPAYEVGLPDATHTLEGAPKVIGTPLANETYQPFRVPTGSGRPSPFEPPMLPAYKRYG